MARSRPADRIDRIVEAAVQVFTERGYRRSQMADVARVLGVAPGTLYLYVASKEALFDLVVQRAFVAEAGAPPELPLPTPPPGATLRRLRARFEEASRVPALQKALRGGPPTDAGAELRTIVAELYELVKSQRLGLRLIEKSILDWPELMLLYQDAVRIPLIQELARYLRRRINQGALRSVPDVDIAARLLLESVAWFALHRLGDPTAHGIDDTAAAATIADVLATGFVAKGKR